VTLLTTSKAHGVSPTGVRANDGDTGVQRCIAKRRRTGGALDHHGAIAGIMKIGRELLAARRISHAYIMDIANRPDLLIVPDAAINIFPTVEDKREICQNAIDLAQAVGFKEPKVAVLSAVVRSTHGCPRPWTRRRCARWPIAARSPEASSTGRWHSTTP
jgi:hypothetical protein